MKKFIKMLAMVLSLAMVITLFVPMTEPVQVAAVKLNYSKKTIYEGDSLKLKVNGTKQKVKWSSSNKKIASVNSKGVVAGKNEGVATITAKVAKKSLKCKVMVREKSKVTYINNRSVEYNSDANVERLFFGFKDQYDHVVDGSGIVKIRIENSGEIVYEKAISFKQYDFGYWTNRLYGERYLCSIDIPISEIKEGKSDSGKIYYQVIEEDAKFDEYSLSISNLPKTARKIDVDTTTYIPDRFNPENKVQIVKYSVSDNKIYITYKMVQVGTPNRGNYGAYIYQYDEDGNIIDDIYIYTNNLTVGDTFTSYAYLEKNAVKIGI